MRGWGSESLALECWGGRPCREGSRVVKGEGSDRGWGPTHWGMTEGTFVTGPTGRAQIKGDSDSQEKMARDRGWGQLSMVTQRGEVSTDVLGVETGSPEPVPYDFPRDHIGRQSLPCLLSKHTGDRARGEGRGARWGAGGRLRRGPGDPGGRRASQARSRPGTEAVRAGVMEARKRENTAPGGEPRTRRAPRRPQLREEAA